MILSPFLELVELELLLLGVLRIVVVDLLLEPVYRVLDYADFCLCSTWNSPIPFFRHTLDAQARAFGSQPIEFWVLLAYFAAIPFICQFIDSHEGSPTVDGRPVYHRS